MQGHAQARPLRAGGRERRNKDTQLGAGQNRTAASAASADASDLRFLLLFCSVMSRQLARSLLSSTPSTPWTGAPRPEHVK